MEEGYQMCMFDLTHTHKKSLISVVHISVLHSSNHCYSLTTWQSMQRDSLGEIKTKISWVYSDANFGDNNFNGH